MAYDVFLSHSAKDKSIVDAVCAALEAEGIRCWVAPRDILPGMSFGRSIIEAIGACRLMVLVFSANSNASQHVMRELERAVHRGIPIVPFRIEDTKPSSDLEYFLSATHWLDALTPPVERHIQHLTTTVNRILGRNAEVTERAPDAGRLEDYAKDAIEPGAASDAKHSGRETRSVLGESIGLRITGTEDRLAILFHRGCALPAHKILKDFGLTGQSPGIHSLRLLFYEGEIPCAPCNRPFAILEIEAKLSTSFEPLVIDLRLETDLQLTASAVLPNYPGIDVKTRVSMQPRGETSGSLLERAAAVIGSDSVHVSSKERRELADISLTIERLSEHVLNEPDSEIIMGTTSEEYKELNQSCSTLTARIDCIQKRHNCVEALWRGDIVQFRTGVDELRKKYGGHSSNWVEIPTAEAIVAGLNERQNNIAPDQASSFVKTVFELAPNDPAVGASLAEWIAYYTCRLSMDEPEHGLQFAQSVSSYYPALSRIEAARGHLLSCYAALSIMECNRGNLSDAEHWADKAIALNVDIEKHTQYRSWFGQVNFVKLLCAVQDQDMGRIRKYLEATARTEKSLLMQSPDLMSLCASLGIDLA